MVLFYKDDFLFYFSTYDSGAFKISSVGHR